MSVCAKGLGRSCRVVFGCDGCLFTTASDDDGLAAALAFISHDMSFKHRHPTLFLRLLKHRHPTSFVRLLLEGSSSSSSRPRHLSGGSRLQHLPELQHPFELQHLPEALVFNTWLSSSTPGSRLQHLPEALGLNTSPRLFRPQHRPLGSWLPGSAERGTLTWPSDCNRWSCSSRMR
ncbi:hypothetical protein G6O67_005995 [Ophiocordyceps sinensis]|uniref:Uncharacterized protein n=1 Tax=Ophiocordyceps sinensis TaxID=72228 RepID=A0A8H4LY47_9HYPO|nr:hypothetical protein G6O67_005995 [Ophiocordyceps sinensis]